MDQAIGRVLATLDVPLRSGKAETFEGGIRVVAVVRWPARIAAGRS